MSRAVKLGLYVVCAIGLIVFGSLTVSAYRSAGKAAEHAKERSNKAAVTDSATNAAAQADTNLTDAATNAVAEAATNAAPTNAAAAKAEAKREAGESDTIERAGVSARSYTKMVTYGLGALVCVLGLAGLIGYDVSHFVATKAEEALYNNDGQPTDPEYEKAEQMWNDGKYLDAVKMMREYLERNPREQYVAIRIAEIYEQNLNNPLAAALEYEEVLKKKLPPERWGWAAIHLANIYSGKLNQPEKSIALLRRIDAEYGQTTAAKKARQRLLQVDPNFVPSSSPEDAAIAAAEPQEVIEESAPAPEDKPNLPPGFRPKA